jgi:hypothetical protein
MSKEYEPDVDAWGEDRASAATTNPIPTAQEVGDDEGFSPDFLGEVTPEQILKESLRWLEPGTHTVKIKSVSWVGERPATKKLYLQMADGTVESAVFDSRVVQVVFCPPGDENLTSRCQFFVPPVESQREAYEHGHFTEADAKSKSAGEGGFFAKQFKFFLGHCLGFKCDANGVLPPEAGKFSNWKMWPDGSPRLISLVVKKGKMLPAKEDPKNPGTFLPPRAYDQPDIFRSNSIPHSGRRQAPPAQQAPTPQPAPEPDKPAKGGKKSKVTS